MKSSSTLASIPVTIISAIGFLSRSITFTWSNISSAIKSDLLMAILSDIAICSAASIYLLAWSIIAGADATQIVWATSNSALSDGLRPIVRRMLLGTASPDVSIMQRLMSPSELWRSANSMSVLLRSSCISQQTHPLGRLIILPPSEAAPMMALSTSTSPNSFTSTAVPSPNGDSRYLFKIVVLPAPRKPVNTVK